MKKIELTNNQILKEMVKIIKKKGYTYSFEKELHVDIQNCEPIDVKNEQYNCRTQSKNYFYFLDKEFNLLAVLQGSKYLEDYEGFTMLYNSSKNPLNRIVLEPLSTYILMITSEMREQYNPHIMYKEYKKFQENEYYKNQSATRHRTRKIIERRSSLSVSIVRSCRRQQYD
jgi:hypothetical protein